MSERTPQDVLRELRMALLAELDWINPLFDSASAAKAVGEYRAMAKESAVRLLDEADKAIAEAPDGPPCDYCGHADEQHGDADPECTIKDCHCPAYRSGTRLRRAAPDTLSGKPGLDVEKLTAAVISELGDPAYIDARKEPITFAHRVARAYSGSIDSEGR